MSRVPNPMYIFSSEEKSVLTGIYMREHSNPASVHVGDMNFSIRPESMELGTLLVAANLFDLSEEKKDVQKIILQGHFPTTINVPHHINEDGDRENQPEREGPIRTYFDGSHISGLGHAVAISIDNEDQSITTQCPWGKDLPEYAENILGRVFPDWLRVTMRHKQQQDSHSCAPLTLHNIFSMAGIHEQRASIDIHAWRSKLLGSLEAFEAEHGRIKRNSKAENLENYGHEAPIFCQRYL